ncbi:MAG: hypothetical protein JXR95_03195 [Deltaproteobacteria bacterium]|nr:hypothetical protein [Deltaproteobacteria bacterium]
MDNSYNPSRRVLFLSFFKIALVTFLLMFSVIANMTSARTDLLKTTLQWSILGLIALEYAGVIFTGIILRFRENWLNHFLIIMLTIDTLVTAALVHFTGGALSPYSILFIVVIISSAITLQPRPTFYITFLAITAHVFISIGHNYHMFHTVQGQITPLETLYKSELARHLSIHISAFATISALSIYLAQRLNKAEISIADKAKEINLLKIRHRDILESLFDGVITIDADGKVLTCNRRSGEIMGKTIALGSDITEYFPGDILTEHSESIPWRTHLKNSIPVELTLSSFEPNRSGPGVRVLSIHDRSEIEILENEMARQEKLAALGRMSASIAHEIRNPLASISGSLELLRSGISTVDGDENTELFNIVFEEIDRLNMIVSEILNYTRTTSLNRTLIDIQQLLNSQIQLILNDSRWTGGAIELEGEKIRGLFDEKSLKQIFLNIIINSLESGENIKLKISCESINNTVQISFADNGRGIPGDTLEHIFEPFFTTKTTGTGLGLSVVKKLVELHGGTIKINSDDNGTLVKLFFPLLTENSN